MRFHIVFILNPGPGGWFSIKMTSYQYRKSHYGDKTILRSSYLHNGISYTGKTTSLYWIQALISALYPCHCPLPSHAMPTNSHQSWPTTDGIWNRHQQPDATDAQKKHSDIMIYHSRSEAMAIMVIGLTELQPVVSFRFTDNYCAECP